jgi:hypothetical protein
VGFETTITASERAKTVHDLDRSATVTGLRTLEHTEKTIQLSFNDEITIYVTDVDWHLMEEDKLFKPEN